MPVVSYYVDCAACVPYAATHYTLHGYTSVAWNWICDRTQSRHWLGSWPQGAYIPSSKQGLFLFIPGGEHPLARPPVSRKRIMPSNASASLFFRHILRSPFTQG